MTGERSIDPVAREANPSDPIADAKARHCGGCTLCCHLPEIESLAKPANRLCVHVHEARGCSIYEHRPQLCRDFLCLWRSSDQLANEWNPVQSGMMVYRQGPQWTVLVHPDHPERHLEAPYDQLLAKLAAEAEAQDGYLILFAGQDVIRIDPPLASPALCSP